VTARPWRRSRRGGTGCGGWPRAGVACAKRRRLRCGGGGFDTSAVAYQTLVEGGVAALPLARVALGAVTLRDGGAGGGVGGRQGAAEGLAAVTGPP